MIEAGFSRIDITPPLGTRLAGYGHPERPAEAVHDHLAATVMVLKQAKTIAAHVTLDVGLVAAEDVDQIRRAAEAVCKIPARHINIGVSHTHSAPQTFTCAGWGDKDHPYVRSFVPKVAQAVAQAHSQCVPVRVGYATTRTQIGVNRRWVGAGPETTFDANEDGAYDATMTVARFASSAGTIGALVHCSAHCTAMGINRLISRDWAGVMTDRIESQIHAPVLFINGAFGDVGPRTNMINERGRFQAGGGDGIHSVNECGYRAAGDALRAFQSIKHLDASPQLKVLTGNIQIPLAPLPSVQTAEAGLRQWRSRKDEWGEGMCRHDYWSRVIDAHRHPAKSHMDFTQTLIALGALALVPLPGEPFTSIALRLRALSPFQYTLVCGGCNGDLSYFPDCEARARGGYEAWVSIGTLTQLLSERSDDALVNTNAKLLEKLYAKLP